VGPGIRLYFVEERKILPLLEIVPRTSSPWPVAIPPHLRFIMISVSFTNNLEYQINMFTKLNRCNATVSLKRYTRDVFFSSALNIALWDSQLLSSDYED
jgi:hypothetical protein